MVLPLLIAVLAAAAASTPLLVRLAGRNTGWLLAAVFLALAAVAAAQAPGVVRDGEPVTFSREWMPAIGVGLDLRMDSTGLLFTLLVLGVGAVIMAYSARYFPPGRRTGFYLLMTAFAVAMLGLVLADDVVLLFVFWELTTICSFYLIGLSGPAASRPAIRTFLVTALGGLALLAAVVLLMVRTGTSRLSEILADPVWTEDTGFTAAVASLLILAVFTKSAQFPFHYWLPDAMAASTPVSAYLHAAAMVKAGIYLLIRFSPALADVTLWNTALITAGLVTALLGAVLALRRTDLKELLAYSTVSQLGFLVAVIGIGTPAALTAAAVHTVAHALFKSALFMLVGIVDVRAGSRDLADLGGLRRTMPVTATLTALAALSMAGVPPLLGFVSKENVFAAFLGGPGPDGLRLLLCGVAMAAAAVTFAYTFRLAHGAFGGPPGAAEHAREAPVPFLLPPALVAGAGLVLAPGVGLLNGLVGRVTEESTGTDQPVDLALWHGVSTELVMSAVVIAVGVVLAWHRLAVDRALSARRLPVSGTAVFESLHGAVIRGGRRVGDLTRSDSPTRHLAVPVVLVTVLALCVAVASPAVPDVPEPTARAGDWVLVVLIVGAVLTAVVITSRLAALALIGVAGFAVALWFFFLGAFDVALTQLMVEILTVVVAVLVLRRLPRTFHRVTRRRTAVTAAIAIAAGVSAGVAAWTLTGRREISDVARYFMAHAEEDTGGSNVVNTILVDYRALDTLGELTVLGVAGLIIMAVLNSSRLIPGGLPTLLHEPLGAVHPPGPNTVIVRTVARWLVPVLIIWSVYLLLRGHNAPGGGFIGGLVGGSAFALTYLAAPRETRSGLPYPLLIGGGIALGTVTGLIGFVDGSFLRPLHADIPLPGGGSYHFTSALVFDVAVYLVVVGVLLTALDRLGTSAGGTGDAVDGTGGPRRVDPDAGPTAEPRRPAGEDSPGGWPAGEEPAGDEPAGATSVGGPGRTGADEPATAGGPPGGQAPGARRPSDTGGAR